MADMNREKSGVRPPNSRMLRRTLFLLIVCGIAAFLVLIGKLFDIQILHHKEYETAAPESRLSSGCTAKSAAHVINERNSTKV